MTGNTETFKHVCVALVGCAGVRDTLGLLLLGCIRYQRSSETRMLCGCFTAFYRRSADCGGQSVSTTLAASGGSNLAAATPMQLQLFMVLFMVLGAVHGAVHGARG